jgi:hypothetical protein
VNAFPFDLLDGAWLARTRGTSGDRILELEGMSLKPPWPWGQWLYGQLINDLLPDLRGDLVECGVAKGGMSLYLGEFAKSHGRQMFALDSFEGLPLPSKIHDNAYFMDGDYAGRADREPLYERFCGAARQRGLSETIRPIRGMFSDTLSTIDSQLFSFAHIDADLFESVLQCIEHIWPRLCEGGLLAVDDYFHHGQGPARAVSAFFASHRLEPLVHVVFPYSVLIQKGRNANGRMRSLDGRCYSFELLRRDAALVDEVHLSLSRALNSGNMRAAQNASLLSQILDDQYIERSSSIFDYLRSLEDYWDDMAPAPEGREGRIVI